jgi:hypothetical protein
MAIKAKYVNCIGCKAKFNSTAKVNLVVIPQGGKKIKSFRCPKCGLVQLGSGGKEAAKVSDKEKTDLIEKIIAPVEGAKGEARKRVKRKIDKMKGFQLGVLKDALNQNKEYAETFLDSVGVDY